MSLTRESVRATTAAIQALIDAAARGENGGRAVIPPGEYTCAMLHMRTGVTLHISRGATLKVSANFEDYDVHVETNAGNQDRQPYHFIKADNISDFTIEGDGILDGQGDLFWDKPYGDKHRGAVGLFYRHRVKRVSPMIELRHCQRVTLRDFTIKNASGWTIHPYTCDFLKIDGITIDNNLFGPNTDGIDLNGCRDVFISNCNLKCGDDAIIIKAMQDARSTERVVVTNCVIESNCATLGLGAECHYDIRDICFTNCVAKAALRIIQIEMWEAGTIENVVISNITGRDLPQVPLARSIYMDIQHWKRTDGKLGKLRNVSISNFVAETRGRVMLTAGDGATIDDVTLRDITLTYPEIEDPQQTVNQMRSSQMSNSSPETRDKRAALVCDNVRNLRVFNMQTHWPDPALPAGVIEDHPVVGVHRTLPMHAGWFRNTTAHIESPALTASQPGLERFVQHNAKITVRD